GRAGVARVGAGLPLADGAGRPGHPDPGGGRGHLPDGVHAPDAGRRPPRGWGGAGMTSPAAYLLIPPKSAEDRGGLRWAPLFDPIETREGRTFAPVEEVGSFLEGFASRRPLIHFAHVLHLLVVLRWGEPRPEFAFLAR